MPELTTLLAFCLASLVLAITPGPAMLYVISTSVGFSRKAGIISSLGAAFGMFFHVLAVAFGLSALLLAVPFVFDIIKIAGALYLLYLGIKTITSKSSLAEAGGNREKGLKVVFYQGMLTGVINPKLALFFLAFLPQFVDPSRGSVTWQLLFLGLVLDVVTMLVNLLIAFMSSLSRDLLQNNRKFITFQNWFAGSIFMFYGAQLVFAEHK